MKQGVLIINSSEDLFDNGDSEDGKTEFRSMHLNHCMHSISNTRHNSKRIFVRLF